MVRFRPGLRSARSWIGLAALGLTALVAACTSPTPAPVQPMTPTFTLTARDLSFTPGEIVLRAGAPVRLTFVNEGVLEHDVTIVGLNANGQVVDAHGKEAGHSMGKQLPGTVHLSAHRGERATAEFTPAPGTYEFACTIAGHKEAGMAGTIRAS
jgi:uncharacterized cupredoxin-like copper-binding protein